MYEAEGKSYALIANNSIRGLQIIEITDPTSPGIPMNVVTDSSALGVGMYEAEGKSFAFIVAGTKGLQIIEITDPTNPGIPFNVDTDGSARGVSVYEAKGNCYALIADYD